MNIVSIIKILNELKRKRKLKDYAVFGAIGASYYMEPIYTKDIDVLVLADTDQDYVKVWRELSKYAKKTKDFGFIIEQTEVQILPTSIHPMFKSALSSAKSVRTGGITTKVVDREHLILMFLRANRQKDRFKASILLPKANLPYLEQLLRRFDTDGTLRSRLKTLG